MQFPCCYLNHYRSPQEVAFSFPERILYAKHQHGNRRQWQTAPDRAEGEKDGPHQAEMNSWRVRLGMAVVICCASFVHGRVTADLPNDPAAMLLYHGSAALVDLGLLFVAQAVLSGRICAVSQWLLFASMAGNAAGWLLYMSYAPPAAYDLCITVLTAAQLLTLFTPDCRDATHPWDALVRDRACVGRGNNH